MLEIRNCRVVKNLPLRDEWLLQGCSGLDGERPGRRFYRGYADIGFVRTIRSSRGRDRRQQARLLSRRQDESPTGEVIPSAPEQDRGGFDGRWIFTSAGCPHTVSLPATIRKGQIIVAGGGGFVSTGGALNSVGAGGGMTLTAIGQLSGNSGSGTFNRSDGCVGTWVAVKRR
jgi:hypothetical protein